ncbi:MMPL family transporter [Candidatus Nanohalovita haloferacivicina]|uniref:MMPL family transporter n=1 Tax=Candidatus Nanohalovita haloferacivicina TaxID=2978046 RepID=UPI00325FA641|nr:Putative exporter of the RND superfamily [Candidatus Nanohalobia archaeon BNXNv]
MIIEEIAARTVEIQSESPVKVLVALGVLTAMVLPGALMLDIKPSTEAILPADDPVVESLDTLRAKFGGDTTYLLISVENDVRRAENFEKISRIQNRVELNENVVSSSSPSSLLIKRYGEIPENSEDLREFNYRSMITNDRRTALVAFQADTQASSEEIRNLHDDIQQAAASEFERSQFHLTGYNMIDLATFNVIISDFMTITAVSFAAVLGVLYAVFRDPVRMMFPVVPVMFALVWMLGLGGYLGADLTIISMVSAAMIMGLGIDFGIHVTKKYFSTRRGSEGMSETMTELSRGLLGGATTTGVGFLALLAANLSGMHSLGIFLFTGIISAYIGATLLLPTLILLSDGTESVL